MIRYLRLLLIAGLVGIAAELLLLGHTEDVLQWIPIVLVGLALEALALHRVYESRATRINLQSVMGLLILSGGVGLVLHFLGNREFALEQEPGLSGLALFWEVIRSQSPPALAPGTMALLGALGLLLVMAERGQ